jgi:hypothetical protein
MRYKIWDRQETLVTPTMEILEPAQVFSQYPASLLPAFKFVIADQPINMAVFMEFESTKQHYAKLGVEFDEEMTEQEVLDAITAWEETPVQQIPSPEERIAAALEFQTLLNMPNFAEEEEL